MKLTLDDVKEELNEAGWLLYSKEYTNLKTDLELVCPNGHLTVFSLEQWRRGHKCPICESNKYANVDTKPIKKTSYRILAFDQASITSGWSVFDDDELVSYGTWTSEGTHSTERIALTKGWFASMLWKWKPDEVILEDIQLQKFGNGDEAVLVFKKLAHLQGVLKNYLYENNFRYKVVPPSSWRHQSEIKGKTRSDRKKNAQIKIKALYDVNVSQDAADAILIGAWGVYNHNRNKIIQF